MEGATRRARGSGALAAGLLVIAIAVGVIGGALLLAGVLGGTSDSPASSPTGSGAVASATEATSTPTATTGSSATSDASQSPTGSPGPTASGAAVEAPDGFLPPGSMVTVTVDALHMRNAPAVDATVVTTLGVNAKLEVGYSRIIGSWGPVEADGLRWYPVQSLETTEVRPVPDELPDPNADRGWVADGDGTDAFLDLVPARCVQGEPQLAVVQSQLPWERLACYGDRSMTLEGVFGCPECDPQLAGTFEPEWLASPARGHFLSVEPRERFGPLLLHFPPDGPEPPPAGSIVVVAGHFDDPAADGCVVDPEEPSHPVSDQVAELHCREQFVVERVEVRGEDEDFPGG